MQLNKEVFPARSDRSLHEFPTFDGHVQVRRAIIPPKCSESLISSSSMIHRVSGQPTFASFIVFHFRVTLLCRSSVTPKIELFYVLIFEQSVGGPVQHNLPIFHDVPYWAKFRAACAFCSTSRIEVFCSSLMRPSISKISLTSIGASPSDGSSSISNLGRDIKARPIASICCSPPLSRSACCVGRRRRCGK